MFDSTDNDLDFDVFNESTPREELTAPADLLTTKGVEAVRFYSRRKGYDFSQVEKFVQSVQSSLAFYETALATIEAAYNEAVEDLAHRDQQVSQLKATIEVFRAKGDPMVNSDGQYVTESQVMESPSYKALAREKDELAARVGDLSAQLADLHERMSAAPEHEASDAPLADTPVDAVVEDEDTAIQTVVAEQVNAESVEISQEDTHSPADVEELPVEVVVPDSTSHDDEDDVAIPTPENTISAPRASFLSFAPEAQGHDLTSAPAEDTSAYQSRRVGDLLSDAPEARED